MSEPAAVPPPDRTTVLIVDSGEPGRRFQNLVVRVHPVAVPPRNVKS
jgi:hypothetical protein